MENNYFVFVFGTFGNPNGFKQSFLYLDKNLHNVAKELKTFDLNTNAIKLFTNTEIYAIRKESIQNRHIISYSKYTFAKEPNSDRGGSFIGSSLIFVDKIATENIIISQLNNFHQNLINQNLIDDTLNVKTSNEFLINQPKDYDKIKNNLKNIKELSINQTNNNLVVFCDTLPQYLQNYLEKSIDLLNVYDTIYFTKSEEVANYVKQKNVFPLIEDVESKREFDLEIQKLEEVRQREISEFRKELIQVIKKISDSKEKQNQEFINNIETSKKTHQANHLKIEDAENQRKNKGKDYDESIKQYETLFDKLSKGEKIEILKQQFSVLRSNLRNIEAIKPSPIHLNSISNPTPRDNSLNQNFNYPYDSNSNNYKSQKVNKLGIYKIGTFFLSILLIAAICWIVYPKLKNEEPVNTEVKPEIEEENPTESSKLNPFPNDELSVKIEKGKKLSEVVKNVFENDSIIKFYKYQKQDYSKKLYDQNSGKFSIQGQDTIFEGTEIIAPIYKK